VSSRYSIRPEADAHLVVGVSGGGFGAVNMALKHRDYFGSVATLSGAVNLRYSNRNEDVLEDFSPRTYRWGTTYRPLQVVGKFHFGLVRIRARTFIRPVFGDNPYVPSRIQRENPADLIFTTDLQPDELNIYLLYGCKDEFNLDAQAQSFAWLARSRGVKVRLKADPNGRHNSAFFQECAKAVWRWTPCVLLPPIACDEVPLDDCEQGDLAPIFIEETDADAEVDPAPEPDPIGP
ncbi:MAG: alpha/beta hydrolase-fold protein, partial [Planctomycetales bacterium]